MKRAIFLFLLFFPISACGDLAPSDATINGPVDVTATLPISSSASTLQYHPLEFNLKNASGSVLSDVEIEFFRTGIVGQAFLLDEAGNVLQGSSLKVKTKERGTARGGFQMIVPGCTGTTAVTTSGGIFATVKSASFQWSVTATRACAAATTTP